MTANAVQQIFSCFSSLFRRKSYLLPFLCARAFIPFGRNTWSEWICTIRSRSEWPFLLWVERHKKPTVTSIQHHFAIVNMWMCHTIWSNERQAYSSIWRAYKYSVIERERPMRIIIKKIEWAKPQISGAAKAMRSKWEDEQWSWSALLTWVWTRWDVLIQKEHQISIRLSIFPVSRSTCKHTQYPARGLIIRRLIRSGLLSTNTRAIVVESILASLVAQVISQTHLAKY